MLKHDKHKEAPTLQAPLLISYDSLPVYFLPANSFSHFYSTTIIISSGSSPVSAAHPFARWAIPIHGGSDPAHPLILLPSHCFVYTV